MIAGTSRDASARQFESLAIAQKIVFSHVGDRDSRADGIDPDAERAERDRPSDDGDLAERQQVFHHRPAVSQLALARSSLSTDA